MERTQAKNVGVAPVLTTNPPNKHDIKINRFDVIVAAAVLLCIIAKIIEKHPHMQLTCININVKTNMFCASCLNPIIATKTSENKSVGSNLSNRMSLQICTIKYELLT